MLWKMKLCMFYMEKQPLLLLITITLTAGALFLEKRTSSHLLWADGLGRFSGTIVSSEFRLHGGHILLSLHLGPFKFSFDSTATCISLAMARSSPPTKPPPISSPIIMHAAPSTHRFLHFSFLNLHEVKCSNLVSNLVILINEVVSAVSKIAYSWYILDNNWDEMRFWLTRQPGNSL